MPGGEVAYTIPGSGSVPREAVNRYGQDAAAWLNGNPGIRKTGGQGAAWIPLPPKPPRAIWGYTHVTAPLPREERVVPILRLVIQPIPRDLASFWRKWEWRIVLGTDDGSQSETIDYGGARTERRATTKGADALDSLTPHTRQAHVVAARVIRELGQEFDRATERVVRHVRIADGEGPRR